MDFDKLNQRIAILEHRTVVDEIGNHTSKWDEVFSCWAKVSVKSSAEQVNTGISREIQSVSFLVRQSSYLLSLNATTHRICTVTTAVRGQPLLTEMMSAVRPCL